MSDLGYFIWLIAMAVAIITVLTIGTLAAAGLLGTDEAPTDQPTDQRTDQRDAADASSATSAE